MNNEPVAWKVWNRMGGIRFQLRKPDDSEYVEYEPLYTHPAKTLTDEEIKQLQRECIADAYAQAHFHGDKYINSQQAILNFARAILKRAFEK